MGATSQPQGTQGSSTSECLLEVPFEAYTDSPDDDVNKTVRVQTVPRVVGPSGWRQRLGSFVPSFASRRDDEDSLPLLPENHQSKRSCRSRYSRGLLRALIVFFVML